MNYNIFVDNAILQSEVKDTMREIEHNNGNVLDGEFKDEHGFAVLAQETSSWAEFEAETELDELGDVGPSRLLSTASGAILLRKAKRTVVLDTKPDTPEASSEEEVEPTTEELLEIERRQFVGTRRKVTPKRQPVRHNDDDNYVKDIGNHDILTRSQEGELARRIERGDLEAKEILITNNVRLVISVARKYNFGPDSKVSLP